MDKIRPVYNFCRYNGIAGHKVERRNNSMYNTERV